MRERLGPLLRELRAARPELLVAGLLGNDDLPATQAALDELGPAWTPLHLRRVALPGPCGLFLAGYSGVPITPFRLSDWDRPDGPGWRPVRLPSAPLRSDAAGALQPLDPEQLLTGPTLADELEVLAALGDPARTIYVTHGPPRGLGVDLGPGRRPLGSAALRTWLERHQPPLSLHGHIHEAPRLFGAVHATCGATRVCNPGDSRRRLRALWIDLARPAAPPEIAGEVAPASPAP